jgi:hypothetical protein
VKYEEYATGEPLDSLVLLACGNHWNPLPCVEARHSERTLYVYVDINGPLLLIWERSAAVRYAAQSADPHVGVGFPF